MGGFRHQAFLYAGDDEFIAGTLGFTQAAVAAQEPVLVMTDRDKVDRLRAALGRRAEGVEFADMATVGANPARIIPAWRRFADAHAGDSMLWGIGEPVWAGRSASELVECRHHEALLNLAFADAPGFRLLCPYDISTLGPTVVAGARATHPVLYGSDGPYENAGFAGVDATALLGEELPEPPLAAARMAFGGDELRSVRRRVAQVAVAAGLGADEAHDLSLAVGELATNSRHHGGGAGVLRTWVEPAAVVCEVRDTGRVHDPLVGRRRPTPTQAGGRGVWIANQLCDLVQIRSSPRGTVVRVHKRIGQRRHGRGDARFLPLARG
jgi:anti-sigma regulatory factor (Ser/Thr protein kinase)